MYSIARAGTFSPALGFLPRAAAAYARIVRCCRSERSRRLRSRLAEPHVGDEMTISQLLKSLFVPVGAEPASPAKLDAGSEPALAHSLGALSSQQQGWITTDEARQLFSPMDNQYAFGEMDDQGKANLASFAARHRSNFDIMPVEGRIYFTRNANQSA
jgi:hypothetical protein